MVDEQSVNLAKEVKNKLSARNLTEIKRISIRNCIPNIKIKVGNINESLKAKYILTQKLLIKDNKIQTSMVISTSYLVIPEAIFTATFAKVGYLGLREFFSNHLL